MASFLSLSFKPKAMKHSKTEGGIILSLILIFWAMGLYFEENPAATALGGAGSALLLIGVYLRYFRDL